MLWLPQEFRFFPVWCLVFAQVLCCCKSSDDQSVTEPDAPISATRMNEWQVIGSHNSYKQAIEPTLLEHLFQLDANVARSLEYEHTSLTAQLDLGLRGLELDVFHDPDGGYYSNPLGLGIVLSRGATPLPYDEGQKLELVGLKLFHIQDVDFRSHHLLFKDALTEIRNWSDRNPDHTPIFILINTKDSPIQGTRVPLAFTANAMDSLDMEIKNIFQSDQLITPDLIRGNSDTLEEAILAQGWPDVENVKGRILFVLDENNTKTNLYLQKFPGLRGASLFVNRQEGNPEAAVRIINDPVANFDRITTLVAAGYLVRTRADADTQEARLNDLSRFERAQASGAHIISTDYYVPSKLFASDYQVIFQGGIYRKSRAQ